MSQTDVSGAIKKFFEDTTMILPKIDPFALAPNDSMASEHKTSERKNEEHSVLLLRDSIDSKNTARTNALEAEKIKF